MKLFDRSVISPEVFISLWHWTFSRKGQGASEQASFFIRLLQQRIPPLGRTVWVLTQADGSWELRSGAWSVACVDGEMIILRGADAVMAAAMKVAVVGTSSSSPSSSSFSSQEFLTMNCCCVVLLHSNRLSFWRQVMSSCEFAFRWRRRPTFGGVYVNIRAESPSS